MFYCINGLLYSCFLFIVYYSFSFLVTLLL